MTAAFRLAAPSTGRSAGLRCLCLDPIADATERAVGRQQVANAGAEVIERRVPIRTLHDRLDLGTMLVVIGERRQGHLRLLRLAVAQDQQAIGRYSLGQHLSA